VHFIFLICRGNLEERITIPLAEPFELLIDYGPMYEDNRVRHKYSRLNGAALEERKASLRRNDEDTVQNVTTYSADDVHDTLLFLESIFKAPKWNAAEAQLQRALTVGKLFTGCFAIPIIRSVTHVQFFHF